MSIVPRRKSPPPKLKSVSYYKKGSLSLSSARKPKKDTVKKCKERIQKLLRELAIKTYGGCIALGMDQACGGPLQADHIESRGFANTYAIIENILLLCYAHHFFWKKRHPMRWAALVEKIKGKEMVEWLRAEARKSNRTWTLKDWQAAEEKLKKLLTPTS